MEKRNFLAFAISALLICICATVFIACEDKDDSQEENAPLTSNDLIYGDLQNPEDDDLILGVPLFEHDNNKDISVEVLDVTDTSIKFKLDTLLSDIWTGEPYSIEVYRDSQWLSTNTTIPEEEIAWNGGWQKVETTIPENEIAWIMPSYMIPGEFEINWGFLYGQLPTGDYRIIKDIGGDIENKKVWIYFHVESQSNAAKIHKADIVANNHITDYTKGEENAVTLDISEQDAKTISDILTGSGWTQFDMLYDEAYQNSNATLNYYHIWAEGHMVDYYMDEGKFEAIDFSKTSMYSSKFQNERLRLVLTAEQKEIIDGIIGKYFTAPSRTECY